MKLLAKLGAFAFLVLCASMVLAAQPQWEQDYQKARDVYYKFKADQNKQKFRHNWKNTARLFERVAEKYPKSDRADDALFTAGRLYYGLYKISRVQADLDKAVDLFGRLVKDYQSSSLADDAQLYIALQYLEFRKDSKKAAGALKVLVEKFPDGDITPKARRMLEDLGGPDASEAEKLTAKARKESSKDTKAGSKGEGKQSLQGGDEKNTGSGSFANKNKKGVVRVSARHPVLIQVDEDSGPDYSRVTLHTGIRTKYKFGVLPARGKSDHPRLYVDLQNTTLDPELKGPVRVSGSVLKRIRFAPFDKGVVRVVLDLKKLGEYKVFPMDHPARVVLDISAGSDQVASIIGDKERKKKERKKGENKTQKPHKEHKKPKKSRSKKTAASKGHKTKAHIPSKAASKPGRSLSMLAGLKIRRVAVDAGHGGSDPGAIGPTRALEKDITLDIAKRLVKLLREDKSLGLKEVFLTRSRDRFVPLERRTAIANKKKADLFISIHCNAHRNRKFRGVETFYLDLTNDRYSIKLAARENATSEKTISDLQFILADLALKSHVDDSIALGRSIQKALVGTLRRKYKKVKDHHIKPALFYVLIGARMPSVLVETSFISNPMEEKRLKSKQYRQRVAEGIHTGVKNFIKSREKLFDPDS